MDNWFKAKEKNYESSIKSIADKEIAIYKTEIDKTSLRFNVKTSGVYEKQALVFTELYGMFADLEHDADVAINQGIPWDEKYQQFKNTHIKLLTYWRRNRILLPDSIDVLIQALQRDTFWLVEHYGSSESRLRQGDGEGHKEQKQKTESLKESIPQIRSQLIGEFRNTIGVSD
ncbi:TPA: hypothetical protein GRI80_00070 [Vibrio parahaemolyticus]|nr:hypothetical protein [Vibrio parahaemolyticus]EJX1249008.1 hypothetical protein [Vibrio parahaemolyticus]HAS6746397.1 hypothetical protein [Vibrio parahaemolyticus]